MNLRECLGDRGKHILPYRKLSTLAAKISKTLCTILCSNSLGAICTCLVTVRIMSEKQNLVFGSPCAYKDGKLEQVLLANKETKQIQEHEVNHLKEQISFEKSEGSRATLQEDTLEEASELVSIVMIRAESGEKFVFDQQKIPIFTQKINQGMPYQQYDSGGLCYFPTQSLLDHIVLKLFLPIGSLLYLHSGLYNQELLFLGKNQTCDEGQIQQPFQSQLYPLPSNKVIMITFKNSDDAGDNQRKDEDECLENEEKSKDSSKSIQKKTRQINTNKFSKENDKQGSTQDIQYNNSNVINQNKQIQQMEEQIEYNNDEIGEPQQIVRDILSTNSKLINEEEKRVNERTVKEALQLVRLWRDIHKAANDRLAKGMHHISYEKVSSLNKFCKKKTLDYFFLELRKAEVYGYDFNSNLNSKMGHIRLFNSKMAQQFGDIKDRRQKELVFQLPSHDVLPVDQHIVNQLLREATPNSSGKKIRAKTLSQDELRQNSFQHEKKKKYQNKKNKSNSDKAIPSSDKVQTACSLGENLQFENNQDHKEEVQEEINYYGLANKHQKMNEETAQDFQKQVENRHLLYHNLLKNSIPRDPRAGGRNSTLAFSTDKNFLFLTSHYQIQLGPFNYAKQGGIYIHQQDYFNHNINCQQQQQNLASHSVGIIPRVDDENPEYLEEQQFDPFNHLPKPEILFYHENINNNNNNNNNRDFQHFEGSPNLASYNFFRQKPQSYYHFKNSLDPSNMDYFQHNHPDYKNEILNQYSPLNLPAQIISQHGKYSDPNVYDISNNIKQEQYVQQQHYLKPPNQENIDNESCFFDIEKQQNECDLEENLHHGINHFDETIEDFRGQLSPIRMQNLLESQEQEKDSQDQCNNS